MFEEEALLLQKQIEILRLANNVAQLKLLREQVPEQRIKDIEETLTLLNTVYGDVSAA